jgi:hypothetical protein
MFASQLPAASSPDKTRGPPLYSDPAPQDILV